jgi:NAD(P)-dependent dehydrogenase (short-subunit alcohol dehydrogenase family)
MDADRRDAMLANTAASLPLQRVGKPQDMGEAIYYLATAPFVTGIVLDVDGGHSIRQYANPSNDPMRNKQ